MVAPEDVQATYCATLVDTWIDDGVRHAVVAPGSRSTPMALAIADREELTVHVVHDERVAAFVALGLGLDGIPPLLLCTSGTAAANFFPAVVEAGLSEVPMLVLTADRPARLRGVGAPQTIDQVELFGGHVTWFHDASVPSVVDVAGWRALAKTARRRARGGPVQLNLQFDEPLVGTTLAAERPDDGYDDRRGPLPPDGVLPVAAPRAAAPPAGGPTGRTSLRRLDLDRHRGVILVGGRSRVDPGAVAELHRRTEWPVLADPTSGMRHLEELSDVVVTTFDALLRHAEFADAHAPHVVVRVGRPAASKVLAQWVSAATSRADDAATLVQVGGPGRIDPDDNVTAVASIDDLLDLGLRGATGTTWLARWRRAEHRADAVLGNALRAPGSLQSATEPAVARAIAEASASLCRAARSDREQVDADHADAGHAGAHGDDLPVGVGVVVASSMPVRDLEWFGGPAAYAHANRGANGIDGVMSTALGRALQGVPQIALVGDIAFVHDAGALTALRQRGADVRIVVVDNDGGGIFSFLPQATKLPHERFDALFGTPHGTDVVALATAHGLPARTVDDLGALVAQLHQPGPWVVRIASDRAANVDAHRHLNALVAAALSEPLTVQN